jgi:hypothetical protein
MKTVGSGEPSLLLILRQESRYLARKWEAQFSEMEGEFWRSQAAGLRVKREGYPQISQMAQIFDL